MTQSMNLQCERDNDLLFVDKPCSVATHAPDIDKWGYVELLKEELEQDLHVVHRLDKTTSGVLCFALTLEKAQQLLEEFKNHRVYKKYLFLTDRKSAQDEFLVSSDIEKQGKEFHNSPRPAGEGNSHTQFKRLKRSPFFELWQAEPKTGKPHQIRLHAAQVGLPILGDTLYGGTEFPRLCLHASELEIPGHKKRISPPPPFFERMGLLRDPELVAILSAFDERQRAYNFLKQPKACLRLLHTEVPGVRCDQFGDVLWVYWYRDTAPGPKDLERWQFVANFTNKNLLIRKMQNRGEDPLTQKSWEFTKADAKIEAQWIAEENGIPFIFKKEQGLSPGLFLDQRKNRQKINKISSDKRVLNLFSYTCGFSLVAAAAKAAQVTSVDVSATFLEWGKENFSLNSLPPERYEFFKQDCVLFLKGALKRQRQFDVIICDPPSFARITSGKKKEVFKLDKDIQQLLSLCWDVLADQGTLLFSCNFEKWSQKEFMSQVQKALKGKRAHISPAVPALDYEKLNEEPLMKAVWIRK